MPKPIASFTVYGNMQLQVFITKLSFQLIIIIVYIYIYIYVYIYIYLCVCVVVVVVMLMFRLLVVPESLSFHS